MGVGGSAYESRGVRCFYKLSPAESKMIHEVWHEIDSNLQYHGSGFITYLCEKYPQYVIYFTNEPRHPLNIDVTLAATASVVLESMSYLLLNYYNKPNKFSRMIGYLAMFHKDMELDEQDIINFFDCMIDYIIKVNEKVSPKCLRAIKKYFYCIQEEMSSRMEEYLEFDKSYLSDPHRFYNSCLICDKTIFGHSLTYWKRRKKLWTDRLVYWDREIETVNISSSMVIDYQKKKRLSSSVKSPATTLDVEHGDELTKSVKSHFTKDAQSIVSECEITENFVTGACAIQPGSKLRSSDSLSKFRQTQKSNRIKEPVKHPQDARQRRREKLSLQPEK